MIQLYHRRFKVERVVDGDTIVGAIDNGFYTAIVNYFRLYGLNAPELNSKDEKVRIAAQSAKSWLGSQLGHGEFVLRSFKNPADKYGRFLVEIWAILGYDDKGNVELAEKSINQLMIEAGHAVRYMP